MLDELVPPDVPIQVSSTCCADLQAMRNLTYLFVLVDLSVVRNIALRRRRCTKGKIVESGRRDVLRPPSHCTQALIAAIPTPVSP